MEIKNLTLEDWHNEHKNFDYSKFDTLMLDDFYLLLVEKDGKYNWVNWDGELISDIWFDYVGDWDYQGYSVVEIGNKWNVMNIYGQFSHSEWLGN